MRCSAIDQNQQKNDAADAEAIREAALWPSMRFVTVKSQSKQASAMVFKARDLLVRQKTHRLDDTPKGDRVRTSR